MASTPYSILLLLIYLLVGAAVGSPFSPPLYSSSGVTPPPQDRSGDSLALAFIVVTSIVALVTVIFLCGTAGCCGLSKIHWFGRSRQDQGPMSFENPVANLGLASPNAMPLSQIDVRALEMNPVMFEPLPSINDLSPLSVGSGRSALAADARTVPANPLNNNPNSVIIPFATEDSELYAHDWFDESYPNFQRNNLEFIREVGKGWFGEVLEADAKDIVPFAAKIRVLVKRLRQEANQIDQMRFLDESRVYRDANQGNVLKLLGHSIEKLPFLLIMEHCPQGDLKSYLIANVTRAETLSSQGLILTMALDIAKGLEWMIQGDFKHPDLAARNCQVTSEGRIVIGDYGLSTHFFKDDYYWNSNVPIPLRWAAPETIHCTPTTIQTLKVTKFSNVWSYAVVLWEITEFAKLPYFELSDEEVITRVLADKSYFLGQPTLPYIPFKEELHELMRSCWAIHPQSRPPMAKVISQLQILQERLETGKRADEFDSKWERLGRLSSSSSFDLDDKPPRNAAKKSVSFTGIKNLSQTLQELSPEEERPAERGRLDGLVGNTTVVGVSQEQLNSNRELMEEAAWQKEFEEGGGISQKMLEKTQSVQDMYQLTHVEPSDIHGPESLMELANFSSDGSNYQEKSGSSAAGNNESKDTCYLESSPHGATTLIVESSDMDLSLQEVSTIFGTTTSSEEKELSYSRIVDDSAASGNITSSSISTREATSDIIQESTSSLLSIPDIAIQPSTPGTTPNMTGIDISVTGASPLPPQEEKDSGDDDSPKKEATTTAPTFNTKRRVVFNFDTDSPPNFLPLAPTGGTKPERRTSTPKRSDSSPAASTFNVSNGSDVFLIDNQVQDDSQLLNESCSLSPISLKKARNGASTQSGQLITTLVGASDDLGLDVFQSVTSQIENMSKYDSNSSSDLEDYDASTTIANQVPDLRYGKQNGSPVLKAQQNGQNGTLEVHFEDSPFGEEFPVLAGNIGAGEPLSLTPRPEIPPNKLKPRVLFNETEENSSTWEIVGSNESSWDVISNAESSKASEKTGNSKISTDASVKMSPITEQTPSENGTTGTINSDTDDVDAFWNRQMQSVTNAAADTKSLFALSLGNATLTSTQIVTPSLFPSSDKFVEDIEAANEELGSLILENLEGESWVSQVVPASRPKHEDNAEPIEVKMAFAGEPVQDVKAATPPSSSTQVLPWESEEAKNSEAGSSGPPSLVAFVPSTWNQTLAPARPAIKSPCAQDSTSATNSSLKKSVSFEQKKQIVYEYPPPPPASDSDEEIHALTTFPTIPLHSSLDWDLSQEELEFAEVHPDDSDEDVTVKTFDPMNMYRISGFDEVDDFYVRPSSEPFAFQATPITTTTTTTTTTTLGELRHTRDKLKLDLSKGEASLLDEDPSKGSKSSMKPSSSILDSGVSSINESPLPFFISPSNDKDDPTHQIDGSPS